MARLFRKWYRTNSGLKRGIIQIPREFVFILFLLFGGIYCFMVIDRNLKPTIMQIAETKVHLIATESINRALYDKILYNTDYEDLMTIHKDAEEKLTMIQSNTMKISRIITDANQTIKDTLENLGDEAFSIPLGQALNSVLLANYGPRIGVGIIPVGTVNVGFGDRFEEAGINQVRHLLYLSIDATIKIVVPLMSENVTVKQRIPIAETIIIGDVPNTYLGVNRFQLDEFDSGQ